MKKQSAAGDSDRASAARPIGYLPTLHMPFIGREHEIAEVTRLLLSARLVTLTGAGGCGKTRLALAVASSLGVFENGIWFVDLSDLDDAALVPQVTATALGMPETHGRSLTETLPEYLHAKQLLLILDNCEHLLAACAELAQRVLDNCPNVRVLATSREPLNLLDEVVWLVPSLSLPDPDSALSQAVESEALQLFVARASRALPGFHADDSNAATIAQICRRLDGIPLAIELAAARVKLLDLVQIADRLDECLQLLTHGNRAAAPRHQTLRAALDWSYQLLQPDERLLFRRLAVFAGGCTLEDVEAVCADDPLTSTPTAAHEFLHAVAMLDLLSNLVDKSLVTIAERDAGVAVHYRLLEPIRQFARDELRRSGTEAIVRDRHLAHFVAVAEQAEAQLKGGGQLLWLRYLEKEHDNLRVALAWGTQRNSDIIAGLRLAKALHLFWQRRGYWSEGRRWLAQAIANYDAQPSAQSPGSNLYLARALVAQCWLAIYQMDYQDTPPDLERALALAQALDDRITVVYAQGLLALVNGYTGNTAASYRYAAASVETAQRSNDRWSLAWATYILGWNAFYHRRDVPAAHKVLSESEALFRAVGDKRSIAVHVTLLGIIALDANDLNTAQANYEEALTIGRELRDRDLQIKELANLGAIALLQGNTTRAKELFEETLAQQREWNSKPGIMTSLYGLGQAHILEDDLDAAEALLREALPLVLGQTRQTPQALIVVAFSRIMAVRGRTLQAARVLGAVEANLHFSTLQLIADDRVAIEQNSAVVRAALSPEEFEQAFAAGRSLTLEQALQDLMQPDRDGEEKPLVLTPALDRLRLCALGPTRVFSGEHVLTSWPYARVKELLFYLIAQPPRTKAQIGLALWPEASPAQLRNSLSTTLYHLRRALSHPDWIIFADDHYSFNRIQAYWFDVEAFETNLAQAAQQRITTPEQATVHLQAALELYQGDFVEDLLEGEWFLLQREELRRKYLNALLHLGQLFFAREDYIRAAETYRRAIEKDEVLEAAHRELMRCYARSGERGQALRQYQTLTYIMRDELGSPPAPESVALYDRLRSGENV